MKGYELIKAIQENKVASNIKFKVTNIDKTLSTIVRFDGVDIVYYDSGDNIFSDWFLTTVLSSDFEVIEENKEIDTINAYRLIEIPCIADYLKEKKFDEVAALLKQSELEIVERVNDLVYAINKLIKEREKK